MTDWHAHGPEGIIDVMAQERGLLDLAATLRAVGTEAPAPAPLEAVFFHRTLARWLGLAEGTVDGVTDPVEWDYGYWRADLVREQDLDDERQAFAAVLAWSADQPEETVRWWVKKDARGRIVDAAWTSDPPRLLDDAPVYAPPHLDELALRRLFSDDVE